MTDLPDKELLRPDEVAKYLSVTRKTVYFWIDTGKLEAYKIVNVLRIPREAVLKIKKSTLQ
jgi:excisionase family DNA binding protein